MQNIGGGVAPWNLFGATLERNDNYTTINGNQLIFYHAHALKNILWKFYSSGLFEYCHHPSRSIKKYILSVYIKQYIKATKRVKKILNIGQLHGIRYGIDRDCNLFEKLRLIKREWKTGTLLISLS